MLFFPTKIPSLCKVSYDEPSSTLFVWYKNKDGKEAFKIDRSFYELKIKPVLMKDEDFRSLLIWGERNNFVEKITNAYLNLKLDRYER